MKNNKYLIIFAIVLVLVAGAAFYGGMQYAKSQQPEMRFGQNAGGNRMFGRGGQGFGSRGMGGAVVGEVVDMDTDTLTVKLQDGSSKIVNVTKSTSFNKSDNASVSDISKGTKVAAFGMSNSDGSVTAQSVQINPMMRVVTNNVKSK